jgi:hypothetical protein
LAQLVSTLIASLESSPNRLNLTNILNLSLEWELKPWDFDPIDHPTVSKEVIFLICTDLKATTSPMQSLSWLQNSTLENLPMDRLVQTFKLILHNYIFLIFAGNLMIAILIKNFRNIILGLAESQIDLRLNYLQKIIDLFNHIQNVVWIKKKQFGDQFFEEQEFDMIFSLFILEGLKLFVDEMEDAFLVNSN